MLCVCDWVIEFNVSHVCSRQWLNFHFGYSCSNTLLWLWNAASTRCDSVAPHPNRAGESTNTLFTTQLWRRSRPRHQSNIPRQAQSLSTVRESEMVAGTVINLQYTQSKDWARKESMFKSLQMQKSLRWCRSTASASSSTLHSLHFITFTFYNLKLLKSQSNINSSISNSIIIIYFI